MKQTDQVKLSPAQQRALDIIAAHPGRDPRNVSGKIRVATLRYLERQGLVTIQTIESTARELRVGSFGRWIGGAVDRASVRLQCTKN